MIINHKEKRFSAGQRIQWMQKNQMVPHPQGKTDRKGDILPVMRTKQLTGTIIHTNIGGYEVKPDDRAYHMNVSEELAVLIK